MDGRDLAAGRSSLLPDDFQDREFPLGDRFVLHESAPPEFDNHRQTDCLYYVGGLRIVNRVKLVILAGSRGAVVLTLCWSFVFWEVLWTSHLDCSFSDSAGPDWFDPRSHLAARESISPKILGIRIVSLTPILGGICFQFVCVESAGVHSLHASLEEPRTAARDMGRLAMIATL